MKPLIAFAALWAGAVFGFFFLAIHYIEPFSTYNRDQQLSFFQSAVGLAGFGAGAIAIGVAANQFASSNRRPRVRLKDFPQRIEIYYPANGPGLSDSIEVVLENSGDSISTAWHVSLAVVGPFQLRFGLNTEGVSTLQKEESTSLSLWGTLPLFRGRPVSIVWVILQSETGEQLPDTFVGELQISTYCESTPWHQVTRVYGTKTAAIAS